MTDHSKTSQDLRTLIASKIAHARDYAEREGFMVSTVCLPPEQADIVIAALSTPPRPDHAGGVRAATYYSTQATECAVCRVRKHTPLRVDDLGGYVCLTCIDRELESALPYKAAALAAQAPPQAAEREGPSNMLLAYNRLDEALREFGETHERFGARAGLALERAIGRAQAALAPSPTGTEASRGVGAEDEQTEFDKGAAFGWKSASGLIQTHRDMQEKATARAVAAEVALAATPTPPISPPDSTGQGEGWPGVDRHVVQAAQDLCEERRGQPEWLWYENEHGRVSFGRWPKSPTQAPYVRADIPLANPSQADAQTQEGGR